ncbi:MAG: lasso peptide biosynthesis B2 protein, partial [bacterium]
EAIQLGLEKQMHQAREKALLLAVFLFGSILLMALYHLGFYILRTKDRAYLFFGLFCLLIAIRLMTIDERFLLYLFPQTDWELLAKLEYLSYYLALPVFAIFLRSLYPEDFAATVLRTIQITSAVFCGIVLFTPGRVFSYTVPPHHIYTILACGYGVYLLVLATARRREGAGIIFLGFSILFTAILNDILEYFRIIHTHEILPFGLLAFIFFQAILLLLSWHGHDAELHIGVRRRAQKEFQAHAWIERENKVLIGTAEYETYKPLWVWEQKKQKLS